MSHTIYYNHFVHRYTSVICTVDLVAQECIIIYHLTVFPAISTLHIRVDCLQLQAECQLNQFVGGVNRGECLGLFHWGA
jgi:hypothetical protein